MSQIVTNLVKELEFPVKDKTGNFSFVKITDNTPIESDSTGQAENTKSQKAPQTRTTESDQSSVHDRQKQEIKNEIKFPSPISSPKLERIRAAMPNSNTQDSKARHYIDVADEEEVAQLQIPEKSFDNHSLEIEVRNLVGNIGQQISQEQKLRLEKVIVTFYRNIRNQREIKEVLLRELARGGIGLSASLVDGYLKKIKDAQEGILQKAVLKNNETDQKLPPPADQVKDLYDDATVANIQLPDKTKVESKSADKLFTEVKPRSNKSDQNNIRPDVVVTKASQPHAIGPVEEMGMITLDDFRRLSAAPKDAADRLWQKIDLLGICN